jgi:hypothetical protein
LSSSLVNLFITILEILKKNSLKLKL